jgi:hypothetical protein
MAKEIESKLGTAKSAHRKFGEKTQHLICECGGEIGVVSRFTNGHLMPQAECGTCHKTARRPKFLMKEKIKVF